MHAKANGCGKFATAAIVVLAYLFCGCSQKASRQRTAATIMVNGVAVEEVTFYSSALSRRMRYLALLPAGYDRRQLGRYTAFYLLHGAFGAPEDWLKHSHLAEYVRGLPLVLIMPQGDNSYYVNSATRGEDRYEDYIVRDLASDVELHYHINPSREFRAIAGISMGGFGALQIALKHPADYSFVASISNVADAPERPFSIRRWGQYWRLRRVFGPYGSQARAERNLFMLIKNLLGPSPRLLPTMYLACGTEDSLVGVNRRLNSALETAGIQHVYRESAGSHDWNYWDVALRDMVALWRAPSDLANQFFVMVEAGTLLTNEGLAKASVLFEQPATRPVSDTIYLMPNFSRLWKGLGPDSLRLNGNQADVLMGEDIGTIGLSMRYKPPRQTECERTLYVFRLVLTTRHRELGCGGPWEWKMEGSPGRWATINGAIAGMTSIRGRTADPVVRSNADGTIAILKRMR